MPVNQTLVQKLTRTKPVEAHAGDDQPSSGGLTRSLGLFSLTMIGVGATIGTGIFFTTVSYTHLTLPTICSV